MINFPFGTNGKLIILGVPILKHITVTLFLEKRQEHLSGLKKNLILLSTLQLNKYGTTKIHPTKTLLLLSFLLLLLFQLPYQMSCKRFSQMNPLLHLPQFCPKSYRTCETQCPKGIYQKSKVTCTSPIKCTCTCLQ